MSSIFDAKDEMSVSEDREVNPLPSSDTGRPETVPTMGSPETPPLPQQEQNVVPATEMSQSSEVSPEGSGQPAQPVQEASQADEQQVSQDGGYPAESFTIPEVYDPGRYSILDGESALQNYDPLAITKQEIEDRLGVTDPQSIRSRITPTVIGEPSPAMPGIDFKSSMDKVEQYIQDTRQKYQYTVNPNNWGINDANLDQSFIGQRLRLDALTTDLQSRGISSELGKSLQDTYDPKRKRNTTNAIGNFFDQLNGLGVMADNWLYNTLGAGGARDYLFANYSSEEMERVRTGTPTSQQQRALEILQDNKGAFNLLKGQFGDYGQGFLGGTFYFLNAAPSVISGAIYDVADAWKQTQTGKDPYKGLRTWAALTGKDFTPTQRWTETNYLALQEPEGLKLGQRTGNLWWDLPEMFVDWTSTSWSGEKKKPLVDYRTAHWIFQLAPTLILEGGLDEIADRGWQRARTGIGTAIDKTNAVTRRQVAREAVKTTIDASSYTVVDFPKPPDVDGALVKRNSLANRIATADPKQPIIATANTVTYLVNGTGDTIKARYVVPDIGKLGTGADNVVPVEKVLTRNDIGFTLSNLPETYAVDPSMLTRTYRDNVVLSKIGGITEGFDGKPILEGTGVLSDNMVIAYSKTFPLTMGRLGNDVDLQEPLFRLPNGHIYERLIDGRTLGANTLPIFDLKGDMSISDRLNDLRQAKAQLALSMRNGEVFDPKRFNHVRKAQLELDLARAKALDRGTAYDDFKDSLLPRELRTERPELKPIGEAIQQETFNLEGLSAERRILENDAFELTNEIQRINTNLEALPPLGRGDIEVGLRTQEWSGGDIPELSLRDDLINSSLEEEAIPQPSNDPPVPDERFELELPEAGIEAQQYQVIKPKVDDYGDYVERDVLDFIYAKGVNKFPLEDFNKLFDDLDALNNPLEKLEDDGVIKIYYDEATKKTMVEKLPQGSVKEPSQPSVPEQAIVNNEDSVFKGTSSRNEDTYNKVRARQGLDPLEEVPEGTVDEVADGIEIPQTREATISTGLEIGEEADRFSNIEDAFKGQQGSVRPSMPKRFKGEDEPLASIAEPSDFKQSAANAVNRVADEGQRNALRYYLDFGAYKLNSDLNKFGVTKEISEHIKNLDAFIEQSPRIPEQTFYRGAKLKHLKDLEVGKVLEMKGYTSASLEPVAKFQNVYHYPIQMEITTGNAVNTFNVNEQEVLLPRNSKFRIDSIEEMPTGQKLVKMTDVTDDGSQSIASKFDEIDTGDLRPYNVLDPDATSKLDVDEQYVMNVLSSLNEESIPLSQLEDILKDSFYSQSDIDGILKRLEDKHFIFQGFDDYAFVDESGWSGNTSKFRVSLNNNKVAPVIDNIEPVDRVDIVPTDARRIEEARNSITPEEQDRLDWLEEQEIIKQQEALLGQEHKSVVTNYAEDVSQEAKDGAKKLMLRGLELINSTETKDILELIEKYIDETPLTKNPLENIYFFADEIDEFGIDALGTPEFTIAVDAAIGVYNKMNRLYNNNLPPLILTLEMPNKASTSYLGKADTVREELTVSIPKINMHGSIREHFPSFPTEQFSAILAHEIGHTLELRANVVDISEAIVTNPKIGKNAPEKILEIDGGKVKYATDYPDDYLGSVYRHKGTKLGSETTTRATEVISVLNERVVFGRNSKPSSRRKVPVYPKNQVFEQYWAGVIDKIRKGDLVEGLPDKPTVHDNEIYGTGFYNLSEIYQKMSSPDEFYPRQQGVDFPGRSKLGEVADGNVVASKAKIPESNFIVLPEKYWAHGTRLPIEEGNIRLSQLDPSAGGTPSEFGLGIYFTKEADVAWAAAKKLDPSNRPPIYGIPQGKPIAVSVGIFDKAKVLNLSKPAPASLKTLFEEAVVNATGDTGFAKFYKDSFPNRAGLGWNHFREAYFDYYKSPVPETLNRTFQQNVSQSFRASGIDAGYFEFGKSKTLTVYNPSVIDDADIELNVLPITAHNTMEEALEAQRFLDNYTWRQLPKDKTSIVNLQQSKKNLVEYILNKTNRDLAENYAKMTDGILSLEEKEYLLLDGIQKDNVRKLETTELTNPNLVQEKYQQNVYKAQQSPCLGGTDLG